MTVRTDPLADVERWVAPEIATVLRRLPDAVRAQVQEIRLRAGGPLHLVGAGSDLFPTASGEPATHPHAGVRVDPSLVDKTWQIVCEASVYSREAEARQGFVTLPGGHRVGVAGRVIADDGRVVRFRDVAALNVRIARAMPGCGEAVLPRIWDRAAGLPHHTLILSPPGAGKTTLLRDLARLLSWGAPASGVPGLRVVVVDERSEVAACHRGQPRHDVGPRTDVLDGCPKAVGIQMALRSLNPQLIVFDELGSADDARAVLEAAHAGVRVLTTAHGWQLSDLRRRPSLTELWEAEVFSRVIVLGRHPAPGTVRYAGPLSPVPGARVSVRGAQR